MKPMTKEEKNRQIRKEALWTVALFLLCFAWHVGFGYGLNSLDVSVMGLPLWWIISTPGVFVIAVVGVIILLKKVFVNFDLEGGDEHDA